MGKQYYKPLPECLTIKESTIEGLGLYATQKIDAGVNLGITHIKDERFEDNYIRTALGSFFNHSITPNCKVVYEDDFIFLMTIEEVQAGDELTATYTFYDPTEDQDSV